VQGPLKTPPDYGLMHGVVIYSQCVYSIYCNVILIMLMLH